MDGVRVEDLKVGDRVGVTGERWNPIPEIRTVAKRTATQVVLDNGTRWNKYGRLIGSSTWNRRYLMSVEEAQAGREDELKRRARLGRIKAVNDFKWENVSDEGLEQVLRIGKEHQFWRP